MKTKTHTVPTRFKHLLRTEVSEVNELPSMTRPEQVRPLDVLLRHRAQGIPVPVFNGVFSDSDTPDISKMDFIEIAELREITAQNIELAKEDFHALTKRFEELKTPLKEEPKTEPDKPDSDPGNKTP